MPVRRAPLSATQFSVLEWVSAGCPDGRFEGHAHKLIARALANRGLVEVKRAGGIWRAVLLPDGAYYLEHRRYPGEPTRPAPVQRAAAAVPKAVSVRPNSTVHEAPSVRVGQQIRNPHPAVCELLDHPNRMDLPGDIRRRAHLISHGLVQEALRRQWVVTPVLSTMRERWSGGRGRAWDSKDLFRIDAGAQAVGVRFRLRSKRTNHVDTPDEARRRASNQYVFAPRYDYALTTILRLALYAGGHQVAIWEDTSLTKIEDRLVAVLSSVDKLTADALSRRQAERERQELERARRQEADRQRARVNHYETWLLALKTLRSEVDEHAALAAVVARLQAGQAHDGRDPDPTLAFVDWAMTHLAASDPLQTLQLPVNDAPDMSWVEYQQQKS